MEWRLENKVKGFHENRINTVQSNNDIQRLSSQFGIYRPIV